MTYNTRIARANSLADWAKVVVAGHSSDADRIAAARSALVYTQGALELLQECGPRNIRPEEERLVDRLLNRAEEHLAGCDRNPEPGTHNSEPGTRNPELGTRNRIIAELDAIHADSILSPFAARLVAYRSADDMACVPLLIAICALYRDALKISSLIDMSDPYADEIDSTPFEDEEDQAQARRLKMMFDDFGC